MSLKEQLIRRFVEDSTELADTVLDAVDGLHPEPGETVRIELGIELEIPDDYYDNDLMDELSKLEDVVAPEGTCFEVEHLEDVTRELVKCLRRIISNNSSLNTQTNSPTQQQPAETCDSDCRQYRH